MPLVCKTLFCFNQASTVLSFSLGLLSHLPTRFLNLSWRQASVVQCTGQKRFLPCRCQSLFMCIRFATLQLGQYSVISKQEATSHVVSHESLLVISEVDKANAEAELVTTIVADLFHLRIIFFPRSFYTIITACTCPFFFCFLVFNHSLK